MPNNRAMMYTALETVAVEMEGTGLSRETLAGLFSQYSKMFKRFGGRVPGQVSRDASTEILLVPFSGGSTRRSSVWVSTHNRAYKSILQRMNRNTPSVFGYEFISDPLSIGDFPYAVFPLTSVMKMGGEFISSRASTHFHVGFPHNRRWMQNALKLIMNLDPVLYRLGGAGGLHRGIQNKFNYCRPLRNAPAVFSGDSGRLYRIINVDAALEASTVSEFWASFGVTNSGEFVKYHPCRYVGTNFYSILAHGTLEFRHSNQTLNPFLMTASARFYRAFCEFATVISKTDIVNFPELPYEEPSVDLCNETLDRFYGYYQTYDLEDAPTRSDMNVLMETIEASSVPNMGKIMKQNVQTHIENFRIFDAVTSLGKLQTVSSAESANQLDIHTVEGKNFSIFS